MEELMVDLLELITLGKGKHYHLLLPSLLAFSQAKMRDRNARSHLPALLRGCSRACELEGYVMKLVSTPTKEHRATMAGGGPQIIPCPGCSQAHPRATSPSKAHRTSPEEPRGRMAGKSNPLLFPTHTKKREDAFMESIYGGRGLHQAPTILQWGFIKNIYFV